MQCLYCTEVGGKLRWVRGVFCRRFRILYSEAVTQTQLKRWQNSPKDYAHYATLEQRVFLLPAIIYHPPLASQILAYKLCSEIKPEAEDL